MTTWDELDVDERILLGCLFEWVGNSDVGRPISGIEVYDFFALEEAGLAKMTPGVVGLFGNITPAGITIYTQQEQPPAEPDELTRLREQVAALTAERDALKASVPSLREPVFAIGTRVQLHGTVPRFTVGVVTSVKVYGGYVLKESTWEWVADTGKHVYCIRCDDGAIRHSSRDSMSKVNE